MCRVFTLPKRNCVRIATLSTQLYNKTDKDTAIYVVELSTFGNWFYMTFYSSKLKKHIATLFDLHTIGKYKNHDNITLKNRHELYMVAIMKAILTAEENLKEKIPLLMVDIHTKDMHPKQKRNFLTLKGALLNISTSGKSSPTKFFKRIDVIFLEEVFIEETWRHT